MPLFSATTLLYLLLVVLATASKTSATPAAPASPATPTTDAFRFSIGHTIVTVVQDGRLTFPDNPFLVPKHLVLRSFNYYNPGANPYRFTQNTVLLQHGPHTILVDTGSGLSPNFFGVAGHLLPNLAATGVQPDDITHIILTHGHFDHVSGLVDLKGAAVFPNAKVYITRTELDFWATPLEQLVPLMPNIPPPFVAGLVDSFNKALGPYRARTLAVDAPMDVLPGIELVPSPGHTPGHVGVRVRCNGRSLFIAGDAFHTRSTNVQNPGWNINTDVNGTQAVRTRVGLLESLTEKRELVLAYHAPFPGLGYVDRRGPFFDWTSFAKLG